jgi:hypothetical protein
MLDTALSIVFLIALVSSIAVCPMAVRMLLWA